MHPAESLVFILRHQASEDRKIKNEEERLKTKERYRLRSAALLRSCVKGRLATVPF
jgi:hypothetical protein